MSTFPRRKLPRCPPPAAPSTVKKECPAVPKTENDTNDPNNLDLIPRPPVACRKLPRRGPIVAPTLHAPADAPLDAINEDRRMNCASQESSQDAQARYAA